MRTSNELAVEVVSLPLIPMALTVHVRRPRKLRNRQVTYFVAFDVKLAKVQAAAILVLIHEVRSLGGVFWYGLHCRHSSCACMIMVSGISEPEVDTEADYLVRLSYRPTFVVTHTTKSHRQCLVGSVHAWDTCTYWPRNIYPKSWQQV
jgi:hypothetical protein